MATQSSLKSIDGLVVKVWPDPDEPSANEARLTFEFIGIALAITSVGGWALWKWMVS